MRVAAGRIQLIGFMVFPPWGIYEKEITCARRKALVGLSVGDDDVGMTL